jgi:hypothetical protein
MESRVVVTALILTIIAACTKHEIEIQPFQRTSVAQEKEDSVFFSEWESIPAWVTEKNNGDIIFSYSRQFPQLWEPALANGTVVVFARNLWADDLSLKDFNKDAEKPLMMPFYFLPYFEKPNYTEQWSYNTGNNKITISLVVKGSSDAIIPRQQIQLRYVIIPGQVLKEKNQTVTNVRRLSYDQLIKIFQLSP